jgi:hypothetical protein
MQPVHVLKEMNLENEFMIAALARTAKMYFPGWL